MTIEKGAGSTNLGTEEFSQLAEASTVSLIAEFWDFLRYNKKWWLTPIILVLSLIALLAIWGGSSITPFVYPLI